MVSFSCEVCSDIFKKPKLDSHAARCRGAYYTCIDCSKTFVEGRWKGHTSCISEAEKYQGGFYKPEKGKGKERMDGATSANATVAATVPAVKEVGITAPEVTDAEIKQPKKGRKDKKDKKRKGSPEAITAPTTEVNQTEAKDIPMADASPAESPSQPKPSKKEKKKEKRDKKAKKDKKSKDTPAPQEDSPDSAPATEAVDNKKRKNTPAEDTPSKKKKRGGAEKAKMSQERLAELVGEEELGLAGFLEKLEKEVRGAHGKLSDGEVSQGLRVKVDGGKVVLLFKG